MITVEVIAPYRELVDASRLQQAAARVLALEGVEGELTILVTDDETVADLNARFLGKEGPTDVLSFPAQDATTGFVLPPEEAASPYLGDVIIAFPYTRRQAERVGRALMDELVLLTVHGVLHLLGYDHASPEEKAVMWAKQNAVLRDLGVAPLEV
jgi:probable rRNA maturation factor